MNPNPIPPDSKSEQPEPKGQAMLGTEILNVIVAEIGGYEASHHWMQGACSAVHARVMIVINERLPAIIAAAVEAARAEAAKEITELKGWKESAMTVLNGINLQEVGKVLGFALGSDIGPQVLPSIRQLQAELSKTCEVYTKAVADFDLHMAASVAELSRLKATKNVICGLDAKRLEDARAELSSVREELAAVNKMWIRDKEYILVMDSVIDEFHVDHSCINPLEDLKIAVGRLVAARDGAEKQVLEINTKWALAKDQLTTSRAEHDKTKAELAFKEIRLADHVKSIIVLQEKLTAEQQAHEATKRELERLESEKAKGYFGMADAKSFSECKAQLDQARAELKETKHQWSISEQGRVTAQAGWYEEEARAEKAEAANERLVEALRAIKDSAIENLRMPAMCGDIPHDIELIASGALQAHHAASSAVERDTNDGANGPIITEGTMPTTGEKTL